MDKDIDIQIRKFKEVNYNPEKKKFQISLK